MREPHDTPAGRREGRVPLAVALDRHAGAVVAVAVGLDDEPVLGPAEVDLEAFHHLIHPRPRQILLGDHCDESGFQRTAQVGMIVPARVASRGGSWLTSSGRSCSAVSSARSTARRGSTEERSISVWVGVVTGIESHTVSGGGRSGRWTTIPGLGACPRSRGTVTSTRAAA